MISPGPEDARPCDNAAVTGDLRERVDAVLTAFLEERADLRDRLAIARPPVEEIGRLLAAGGKRIRPAFCYWGFRAAGGRDQGRPDEPIVRAAAALELLHTMALVHDDLIDGAKERRGEPATAVWFGDRAAELGARGDPGAFGEAMAILVGDLAAVLADRLLLESGFSADLLAQALAVYHPMREEMALGQFLALAEPSRGERVPDPADRAALKGGGYTVEGPLRIGAALAGGAAAVTACLGRFGRPLGQAFQLRDDLEDGDAAPGVTAETVRRRVALAKAALDPALVAPDALPVLLRLADEVAG
jgi:geranylgeranyl diphosphate synthase type I